MIVATLSLIGYSALLVVDIFPGRRSAWILHGAAVISLGLALWLAVVQGAPLGWPAWLTGPGWLLTAGGATLLVYSVYIEIPLAQRRRAASNSPATASGPSDGVICTGTYALCRHPGWWWMVMFLSGLILVANHSGVVILALVWATLDLAIIAIQDRYVFPRRFADYPSYKLATPFLFPTWTSIQSMLHSSRSTYDRLSTDHE